MDLKNNAITVGELLDNDKARAILRREFPQLTNPLTLMLARNMRLSEVLELSKGRAPAEQVEAVLRELMEI